MLDQLQSAHDPDVTPRRFPRWVWVVLAISGAAGATVLALHDLTGTSPPKVVAVHSSSAPLPLPAPVVQSTSCSVTATSEAMTGHRSDWPTINAPSGPGPAGVSVLAWTTSPLLRVDIGTGEVARPVLCAGAVDEVLPVTVPWARVMNVDDRGHRRVWWIDPGGHLSELAGDEQTATGTTADAPAGAYAVAGYDGSLLIVTSTRSGQHLSRYTAADLQPPAMPLDRRYELVGEVAQGLVVRQPLGASPDSIWGRLLVLDPQTRHVVKSLGTESDDMPVIQGDRVAWVASSPCRSTCTLRVVDLAKGSAHDVDIPGTRDPATIWKAFSPGGSSIALSYADITARSGRAGVGRVVVVNLSDRSTSMVRGMTTTGNGHPLGATWSGDGRWLVLSASNATFGRFAVWSTEHHRLTAMPWVVPLDISPDLLSAADGPLRAWR